MGLSRAQPPRRPHLKRCGPVPPRGRQRAEPGSHRPRCEAAPERRGGCGIPHGAAVLPASPGTGGQPLSYLRTALLRASRSATCRAPGPPRGPAAAPSRAALLLPSSSSSSSSSLPQGLHGHRGPPTHRRPLRASPRRARAPLPSARPAPHPPPALASPPGPQEGRARAGSARAIGSGGAAGAGRERQRPLLCSARLGSARLGAARCGAAAAAAEGPISAPLRGRQPAPPNVPMATKIDKEACREAYNLVRDDATEVNWVTFKYNGSTIVPGDQGVDYETFKRKCTDDVRLFGFVRFTTGDAMSKRVKFALITWIGEDVSGLQRAKTGTDKTLVKEVVQNFAKEFVISDHKELDEDYIKNELKKAGGANYDAQTE